MTLQREETTVAIKEFPADVCENCGEYYLSEDVTEQVLKMAEEAVARHAEVEVVRFATQARVEAAGSCRSRVRSVSSSCRVMGEANRGLAAVACYTVCVRRLDQGRVSRP